jgi:hypothetical protein
VTGHGRIRRGLRSVGAVVAGFLATFFLSVGTDSALHLIGWFPAVGERMSDGLLVIAAAHRAATPLRVDTSRQGSRPTGPPLTP